MSVREATCLKCGVSLSTDALEGFCQRCLAQAAFGDEEHADSMVPGSSAIRRLGRYELLEEIGYGGMGIVYRARQPGLDREVAIKVMREGPFAGPKESARFRQEAAAAARLRHSNIVAIYEEGEADGHAYFSMELVRGPTLAQLTQDGPLEPGRAARFASAIAEAVQSAHAAGILHRDLKPANVIVDSDDQPRITDFGLAKRLDLVDATVTQGIIGSPGYMSPEQAEPQRGPMGVASDVYSLGALLYQLLTGRPPFAGASIASTLAQVLHNEPVAPRQLNPAIPLDLETICLKCLEKNPEERYASAREMTEDLNRFIRHEPVAARPHGSLYRFAKWVRRNKLIFAAGMAMLSAILMAVVVLSVATIRITREKNQKDEALRQKSAAVEEAREQLHISLHTQARAHRAGRKVGQRLDTLQAVTEALRIRGDDGLRDDAIAALSLPDIRGLSNWLVRSPGDRGVAFDNLYHRYARADEMGILSIRTLPDDMEIRRIATGPLSWNFWLSPDGEWVGTLEEHGTVRVWRVADGHPMFAEPPENCLVLAFSPDSRQLVVGQRSWIVRFELNDGRELNRWPVEVSPYSLVFDPTGKKLGVGSAKSEPASVCNVADGTLLATLPVGSASNQVLAWHPDGRHLAISGSDGRIQVWDVETERRTGLMEGHAQQVTQLTYHPDGGLLASTGWDGVVRLWDAASGRLWLTENVQAMIHFSGDGKKLGAVWQGQERYQILEITPNFEYRSLSISTRSNEGDISPDGRLLALGTPEGVRFWELQTGREIGSLPMRHTVCALFQEDGQALITCTSADGVQRWPIDRTDPLLLLMGRPTTLSTSFPTPTRVCWGDGQRALAAVSEKTGAMTIMDVATNSVEWLKASHGRAGFIAFSPDGRWLASSGWHTDRIRLWDRNTGTQVHEWIKAPNARVFFTPRSRELIICGADEFSFWDIQTLALTRRLPRSTPQFPGYVAFSSDARLAAFEVSPGAIDLMELATSRIVARLEDPFGDRSTWLGFTPDGANLVVACAYVPAIHIWDLRAIGERLRGLGWETDADALMPKGTSSPVQDTFAKPPWKIQVVSVEPASTNALTLP